MLASYLHLLPTEHLKLKWLLRNQKKFFPYYLTASSSAKCNYFPLIKGLHPGSAGSWRSPALNWKLFISAQHSGTQSSRNPNWFPPWHCIPLALSSLETEAKPGLHQLRKLWWCHTQVSSRSQYAHGGLPKGFFWPSSVSVIGPNKMQERSWYHLPAPNDCLGMLWSILFGFTVPYWS